MMNMLKNRILTLNNYWLMNHMQAKLISMTYYLEHQMKGKSQRSKSIHKFKDINVSRPLDVVSI